MNAGLNMEAVLEKKMEAQSIQSLKNIEEEQRNKYHLLLIDDSAVTLRFLEIGLKRFGYKHIYTTTKGSEGLEILKNTRIDLLILDWMMPEIDGIQLYEQIKKEVREDFPAIMVTGEESTRVAISFMNAGGLNFIPKPVNLKHLDIDILDAISRYKEKTTRKNQEKELEYLRGVNQKRADFIADFQDEVFNYLHRIVNYARIGHSQDDTSRYNNIIKDGDDLIKIFKSVLKE